MAETGAEESKPIVEGEILEEEGEESGETLSIAEENRRKFQEEKERVAASNSLWARFQNIGANDPAVIRQRQKQHHTPIEDKERKKRAKAKAKKKSFRTDDGNSMILPSGRGELRVAGTDICMNSGAIKGFAKSAVKKGDYENEDCDDYYYDDYDYYDEEDDEYGEYYYHGSGSHSSSSGDDKEEKEEKGDDDDDESVVECAEGFVECVKETLAVMEDEEKASVLCQGESFVARLSELIEDGALEEEELAKALDVLEKVQDVLKTL